MDRVRCVKLRGLLMCWYAGWPFVLFGVAARHSKHFHVVVLVVLAAPTLFASGPLAGLGGAAYPFVISHRRCP